MIPGAEGTEFTVTAKLDVLVFPHDAFEAKTPIVPLVDPTVTVMVFVVELPVQPEGNIHV